MSHKESCNLSLQYKGGIKALTLYSDYGEEFRLCNETPMNNNYCSLTHYYSNYYYDSTKD